MQNHYTYRLEWSPNRLTVYFDDQVCGDFTGNRREGAGLLIGSEIEQQQRAFRQQRRTPYGTEIVEQGQ